jgi:hypothetical protein
MYTDKCRYSNRVLHCDNPSMESALSALDGARANCDFLYNYPANYAILIVNQG